jgi:hypothetical protein
MGDVDVWVQWVGVSNARISFFRTSSYGDFREKLFLLVTMQRGG